MAGINWRRVGLGGLLAGLVMFVCSAVVGLIMPEVVRASMAEIGSEFGDPAATFPASATAVFVLEYVLLGSTAIWLYAAIRPRCGPGPVTAGIAGFAIWFILEIHGLSLVVLTGLTLPTFLIGSAPYVVVWALSAIAGASVYKEDLGQRGSPSGASL